MDKALRKIFKYKIHNPHIYGGYDMQRAVFHYYNKYDIVADPQRKTQILLVTKLCIAYYNYNNLLLDSETILSKFLEGDVELPKSAVQYIETFETNEIDKISVGMTLDGFRSLTGKDSLEVIYNPPSKKGIVVQNIADYLIFKPKGGITLLTNIENPTLGVEFLCEDLFKQDGLMVQIIKKYLLKSLNSLNKKLIRCISSGCTSQPSIAISIFTSNFIGTEECYVVPKVAIMAGRIDLLENIEILEIGEGPAFRFKDEKTFMSKIIETCKNIGLLSSKILIEQYGLAPDSTPLGFNVSLTINSKPTID